MWYMNSIIPALFPTPSKCKPISNDIATLQTELKQVQAELNTAVGGEKAALVAQIRTFNSQIQTKKTQLDKCIQSDIDAAFSKMVNS
jgi:hypothetical protein